MIFIFKVTTKYGETRYYEGEKSLRSALAGFKGSRWNRAVKVEMIHGQPVNVTGDYLT